MMMMMLMRLSLGVLLCAGSATAWVGVGGPRPLRPPQRTDTDRRRSVDSHRTRAATIQGLSSSSSETPAFVPGVTATGERVGVVGATGYIGRYVVKECTRRGYPTVAVVRDAKAARESGSTASLLRDADIVEAQASDPSQIEKALEDCNVVICCLASRSGMKSDAWAVDHQASVNCLDALKKAKNGRHFVLLSALCVRKPELEFQKAKLETERALKLQTDVSYSIVRPTAFFKSVSGQVENVKMGAPFVFFDLGGGRSAKCNPISEADLASAIVDCIANPARNSLTGDPIWNLGGPDVGFTMAEQGDLIADAVAKVDQTERKAPWLLPVPISLFDNIVSAFDWLGKTFDSDKFRDSAEFARIGRYYAVEDMLTTSEDDKYGSTTLLEHYQQVARDGQEYDPYTTVFGKLNKPGDNSNLVVDS